MRVTYPPNSLSFKLDLDKEPFNSLESSLTGQSRSRWSKSWDDTGERCQTSKRLPSPRKLTSQWLNNPDHCHVSVSLSFSSACRMLHTFCHYSQSTSSLSSECKMSFDQQTMLSCWNCLINNQFQQKTSTNKNMFFACTSHLALYYFEV